MAGKFCSECPSHGPLHALDCSRGRRVRAIPAHVITHPSALGPVLKASVEAAGRGELPVQKRKAAEREAKVEMLEGQLLATAKELAVDLSLGMERTLLPTSGVGRRLARIHEELKALGAEGE